METFSNDALLATKTTPADVCESMEFEQYKEAIPKMCEEAYNEISQHVLTGKTLEEIGLRAMCVWQCAIESDFSSEIFSHLETQEAQEKARKFILTIYGWFTKSNTLKTIGIKALAVLHSMRPDHLGNKTLSALGNHIAGCTKQNLSKHAKAFRKEMQRRAKNASVDGAHMVTAATVAAVTL